jgi:hypothetical protein
MFLGRARRARRHSRTAVVLALALVIWGFRLGSRERPSGAPPYGCEPESVTTEHDRAC